MDSLTNKDKTIVYYTAETGEPWSPKSIETGLAGSQTAVVNLAKQWCRLGYKVHVYANLSDESGEYDGVIYDHYENCNPDAYCDIAVLWREPSYLDMSFNAGRIFLDLHDVPEPIEYTLERMAKLDKILVKSAFHRTMLPEIPDSKFVVISNGIDKNFLTDSKLDRQWNKLVYASSHYRGLEKMLTYGWPIIKKQVPDAELGIYYGWHLFDRVYGRDKEKLKWKAHIEELESQPGVKDFGRVGQQELSNIELQSNILYYGCTFKEIDCITVRQAALVGCIPFTTAYAALESKPYSVKAYGDPVAVATQENLAQMIVGAIKTGEVTVSNKQVRIEELRSQFSSAALQESWEAVAEKWTKLF